MTTFETVKAWKDEEYRDTLTLTEREKLPAHPAGVIELEPSQPHDEWLSGPKTYNCTNYDACTLHHGHCR